MVETIFDTPGGHMICDCDPYSKTPVLVGWDDTINLLDKWCFYHNHIVGHGADYFFIFNEATENLHGPLLSHFQAP